MWAFFLTLFRQDDAVAARWIRLERVRADGLGDLSRAEGAGRTRPGADVQSGGILWNWNWRRRVGAGQGGRERVR